MKPWIKEHPVRKVADRLVVDSSVLVHALGRVREWSRDGRQEVIIVPLEGTMEIISLSCCSINAEDANRLVLAALVSAVTTCYFHVAWVVQRSILSTCSRKAPLPLQSELARHLVSSKPKSGSTRESSFRVTMDTSPGINSKSCLTLVVLEHSTTTANGPRTTVLPRISPAI